MNNGLAFSIFLIAVGAILAFAVNAAVEGIDLYVAGIILMVVGGVGVIASLVAGNRTVVERDREVVVDRH